MKPCIFGRLNPRPWMCATLTVTLSCEIAYINIPFREVAPFPLEHHPWFLHILQTHSKLQMLDRPPQKKRGEDLLENTASPWNLNFFF